MEKAKNNRLGVLLAIYIALKPLYLSASGSVQISDLFLVAATIYLIIENKGKITLLGKNYKQVAVFLVLIVYQLFVNGIWSIALQRNLLKPILYYTFNLMAVLATLMIAQKTDYSTRRKYVIGGCFLSLLITSIGLMLKIGGARGVGFFNNPNQLGYYAILMFALLLLYVENTSAFLKYSIAAMAIWATIASSSKAAFVGVAVMIVLYVLFGKSNENRTVRKMVIRVFAVLLIVAGAYFLFFSESSIVLSNKTLSLLRKRMLALGTESDTALGSGRGYDRILELGVNFLWGMGEGVYERFSSLNGLEAHSSYVTLLVSYGVLGFVGYACLFWRFISSNKREIKSVVIILSGALAYAVTHNGLRNTILWILLALIFAEHQEQKRQC